MHCSSLVRFSLAIATPLAFTACDNPFSGEDCIALGVAAISATVVDAGTNKAPSNVPQLTIEDGAFVEVHTAPMARSDPPAFAGAVERAGTYRVTVTASGYRASTVDGISAIRAGKCQYLKGAQLAVKLVPTS